MPTTTRITNHKLTNNDHNINIDSSSLSTTAESNNNTNLNKNHNINTTKKLIKKKSFLSHNSLASSTLSSSSSSSSNSTNKSHSSHLLFSGKKSLQDKINEIFQPISHIRSSSSSSSSSRFTHSSIQTQSFRLTTQTQKTLSSSSKLKNENSKLVKSNTMSLTERRRLESNLKNNRFVTTLPNTSSYDKLFLPSPNQKIDASTFQQYSHIYKEFTDDCLRPFFNQKQIETNLNDSTQSEITRVPVLSSIIESSNETNQNDFDPGRYIYVASDDAVVVESTNDSSLSTSSSIKTQSQCSLEHKNQSPNLSFNSQSPNLNNDNNIINSNRIKPIPQPRSIYLNYDKQKKKEKSNLQKKEENKKAENKDNDMQEISILLKSLHELEFLVAYHKQILTSNSKCNCSNLVCNLKEFYRVYINMKNLTQFLKNEIFKLYTENCKLKELNDQLMFNKLTNDAKRTAISMSNLVESSLDITKSFNLIKSSSNTTTIAKAIEETECQLALRRQLPFNYLHNQLNDNTELDDTNHTLFSNNTIDNTTTNNKKIAHSSSSSFSSSGYSSQIPNNTIITTPNATSLINKKTNEYNYFPLRKTLESNEQDHFYPIDGQNIIPSSSSSSSSRNSSSNSPECPISKTNNKPTGIKTVNTNLIKNGKSISFGESINSTVSSLSVNSNQHQLDPFNNRSLIPKSSSMSGEEYEDIRDEETEKKRISKGKIIDELIQTEMDYYKVMKLLYDVYLGTNSENIIESAQKELIFCNLRDIMKLSSLLLNDFENNILNKPFDVKRIGVCFLKNANSIRHIYAHYAQYIEYSNNILEKNEKVPDVQRFIQNGLNIIKQQTTSAFDLHSLLLKPIQRVLKYPLLLQELIKNTEVYHEDYEDLNKALSCMQDVATYINEIKRRRDLIVKYGRKDNSQSTIHEKMSKLTLHSMIKKSNRISMKLSNVLGLNGRTTVDEEFDRLEAKFHYFEKLIKCFCKDSIQHLANLKEFFKIQTITAESVQEYYGDHKSDEILQYVHMNADTLNQIYTKNTNFVHEKVLQPLNNLLKLLEVPNKLIQKRRDKLLDYEFAKSNYEKLKDKTFIKTIQDNLYESQKNYEALNNQLLEELPILIDKCSIVFEKCFLLYLTALKNIHERIRFRLKNLNTNFEAVTKHKNHHQIGFNLSQFDHIWEQQLNNFSEKFNFKNITNYKSDTSLEKINANLTRKMSFNSKTATRLQDIKRKKILLNNPVVQIFKNLTSSESISTPKLVHKPIEKPNKQNEDIRNKLLRTYKKEDLYVSCAKYSGFGITSELTLDIDDLVGVLKKADPCGNSSNWFVDNGIVKGIISSNILTSLEQKNITFNQSEFKSELESLGSFEDEKTTHNYVNSEEDNNKNINKNNNNNKYIEYCRALYPFQAIDDTTLNIHEGENFQIIQKHDDNLNDEWWLVEKLGNENHLKQRGYVPSNYVELIYFLKQDNE